MADGDAKRKLVDFLEHRAFNPVMGTDPHNFADDKRVMLAHVQRATQSRIDRFRSHDSAQEIVSDFKRDLASDNAGDISRELKDLGLPTLNDVRDDFEKLAHDLGMKG